MNEQRLVDVELLHELNDLACQQEDYDTSDRLKAIISGPGVEPVVVFAYRRKGLDYFCTCDEDRYNELAQKPNLFEVAVFYTTPSAPAQEWPVLDKPAKVGGGRFHVGVSTRLVVEAAQRHYEYEVTPEKEAARIAKTTTLFDALIAQGQSQSVPDGWQLVPKEPTKKMLATFWSNALDVCTMSHEEHLESAGSTLDFAYKEMLSAAPQPPKESTAQPVACPTDKEK